MEIPHDLLIVITITICDHDHEPAWFLHPDDIGYVVPQISFLLVLGYVIGNANIQD